MAEKLTLSIKLAGIDEPFKVETYPNIYFKENPPKSVYHGVRDETGALCALRKVTTPIDPIYFWGTIILKEDLDLSPLFEERKNLRWVNIESCEIIENK